LEKKGEMPLKKLDLVRYVQISCLMLAVWLPFLLSGCATTEQTKKVELAGFLGDYSQLKKGGGERALLYYINPDANFADYDKVILDPVAIWRTKDSNLKKIPREELLNLGHYLYTAVRKQLQGDYAMVEKPGRGTMRIRLAFTEIEGATVPLDIATTYLPPGRLISEGKNLAFGTHSFVGEATVEMEILDSVSNRRLVAVVDKRAGGKHIKGSTDTWADIKQASDFWAERLRTRLAEFRSK
jgi:hypothetical protein